MISNDFTLTKAEGATLENNDIENWKITFVDTGLHANIGERLVAVRKYVQNEEIFLANYCGRALESRPQRHDSTVPRRDKSRPSWLCRRHRASTSSISTLTGMSRHSHSMCESNLLINGGFFVLRPEIFDYIEPGEELVLAPFQRLIKDRKLHGYQYDRFWCMDTFKEQQQLTDLYNSGRAPWEVWKGGRVGVPAR